MTLIQPRTEEQKWTREGFHAAAFEPGPAQPPRITLDQLHEMPPQLRRAYNRDRVLWHESLEFLPFKGDTETALSRLNRLVRSQPGRGSQPKRGIWIDGESNCGKSSVVQRFAFDYVRERITDPEDGGEFMPGGSMRVPIVWIDLDERPTFRAVNRDACNFLNAPPPSGLSMTRKLDDRTAKQLATTFAGWAIACGVEAVVFDDSHFLKNKWADNDMTGNFLKHLMTKVPAVFIMIGTDLEKTTKLLNEGSSLERLRSQTSHRFKYFEMKPFRFGTAEQQAQWFDVLRSVEKRIVLCGRTRGLLTDRPEYIFERTNGFIGSLIAFVRDIAYVGIHETDDETLQPWMLDDLDTDYAAMMTKA